MVKQIQTFANLVYLFESKGFTLNMKVEQILKALIKNYSIDKSQFYLGFWVISAKPFLLSVHQGD